ncbi:MAG TPA: Rieske 2Fe-2S domain-containing protein [Ktedonobacteraceae bacterium]|nr:Rieske 2Fe-2S domain-containing protein [Ktedonobacteraceae bacterium]
MSGEDKKRFEDYLELEHYLNELQAGHVAHPPADLTPEKADIYRMAALFRSASPDAVEPRPEFAGELQAQLEQELQHNAPGKRHVLPFLRRRKGAQKKPQLSRRALLAGGATVAASLVVGTGIGAEVERANQQPTSEVQPSTDTWDTSIVPPTIATDWHFVTTVANLGNRAVRFTTDALVGYVIQNNDHDTAGNSEQGKIIAISAACTHMGCIVQWQDSDRKYHCPCHGGLFSEYGQIDPHSPIRYVTALPRIETKVEDGKVYVKVPKKSG